MGLIKIFYRLVNFCIRRWLDAVRFHQHQLNRLFHANFNDVSLRKKNLSLLFLSEFVCGEIGRRKFTVHITVPVYNLKFRSWNNNRSP